MKILILGVGGIGGFIGSHLVNANYDVTFVARGERFIFLKSNGLILESKKKKIHCPNINVTEVIPQNISFDIIINTVKLYDFDDINKKILKRIKKTPLIIPFQNGIYAEEKIKKTYGGKSTIGAVAQISVFVDKNQHIKHVGKLATFFVGRYEKQKDNFLENFCEKCQNLGLEIYYKENIKEKIWEKFIFLSAYSGMTTKEKKTIGEIFEDDSLRMIFIDAMKETFNLSKKFLVKFQRNPIDFWIEKIKKMPYDMTSSMHLDLIKKKKLELDWLSGSVVKFSKIYNIKCPTHKRIVEEIKSNYVFES